MIRKFKHLSSIDKLSLDARSFKPLCACLKISFRALAAPTHMQMTFFEIFFLSLSCTHDLKCNRCCFARSLTLHPLISHRYIKANHIIGKHTNWPWEMEMEKRERKRWQGAGMDYGWGWLRMLAEREWKKIQLNCFLCCRIFRTLYMNV